MILYTPVQEMVIADVIKEFREFAVEIRKDEKIYAGCIPRKDYDKGKAAAARMIKKYGELKTRIQNIPESNAEKILSVIANILFAPVVLGNLAGWATGDVILGTSNLKDATKTADLTKRTAVTNINSIINGLKNGIKMIDAAKAKDTKSPKKESILFVDDFEDIIDWCE